jgi:hypothetical protein
MKPEQIVAGVSPMKKQIAQPKVVVQAIAVKQVSPVAWYTAIALVTLASLFIL